MKVGLIVPLVPRDPSAVLSFAELADEKGVDGLFVPDHLTWKGHETFSAFPMLGAIAARTEHAHVGTLVARVGVRPTALLARDFETLHGIAGDRLIAGLGVGDAKSRIENDIYGVTTLPFSQRLDLLGAHCARLADMGIEVWVGGRSEGIAGVGRTCGVTVNLWQAPADEVADRRRAGPVTWAGRVDAGGAMETCKAVDEAGATWAVLLVTGAETPAVAVDLAVEVQARLRG